MARTRRALKSEKAREEVEKQVFAAGESCLEKKAEDVVVLDLHKISDMADYFLIAQGFTDIHVRAVAEHIIETLEQKFNLSPWHVEGMENGRWVLLDYFDFVAHIFQPEARQFYQLERLWGDAVLHRLRGEDSSTPDEEN
jgi:ribosome-associated protein